MQVNGEGGSGEGGGGVGGGEGGGGEGAKTGGEEGANAGGEECNVTVPPSQEIRATLAAHLSLVLPMASAQASPESPCRLRPEWNGDGGGGFGGGGEGGGGAG